MEINNNSYGLNKIFANSYSFTGNPINKAGEELSQEAIKKASEAISAIGKASINIDKRKKSDLSKFTREDITSRLEQGKGRNEICKELGISENSYAKLLKKFGIITRTKRTMHLTASLTKEKLEEILSQNKSLDEISKELGITKETINYHRKKFGIKSEKNDQKEYVRAITREDVLSLIDKNMSRPEICNALNISEGTYTNLLNRFNIVTKQKVANKRGKNISREDITSRLDSNMPIMKICEDLNISWSTFKKLTTEFGIQTKGMKALKQNATITKEQLEELMSQGLSRDEICKQLNISRKTYNEKLNKFGIKSKLKQDKERVASITKEQLEDLINSEKSVDEICEELNISKSAYNRLINKFGIKGRQKSKIDNEIIEKLKILAKEGKSREKICEELQISKNTYWTLCNKAGIQSESQLKGKHANTITKEDITSRLDKNMPIKKIIEELGITRAIYRRLLLDFNIQTSFKQAREKVLNIDVEKFKELVLSGKSLREITQAFNISESTYMNLLRKFNVLSSRKESMIKMDSITKEDMLKMLMEKKSYAEIAREKGISPTSVYRIINKYGFPSKVGKTENNKELWGKPKTYEKYTTNELKDRLLEVFVENPKIAKQEEISIYTDSIYELEDFSPEFREDVIKFIRLLDSVENKKLYAEKILEHPIITKLDIAFEQIVKDAIIKENSINYTNELLNNLTSLLYKNNMNDLAEICSKFKVESVKDYNEKLASKITDEIKEILAKETEPCADTLKSLSQKIIYQEELHLNSGSKRLLNAQKAAKNAKGEIDESKAGQYIINAKRYNKYLKTGYISEFDPKYIKLIEPKLKSDENEAIKYLMKLDSWFNSELAQRNYICDFLKIFDKKNNFDVEIIEQFIKDTYQNIDTTTIVTGDNGAKVKATILASTKNAIIKRHKYPDCIEYLEAFEDGLNRFAPPKGQSGIKIETTGLKRMKIKLIGYPDRLYSSKKNYVFDKYDPDHKKHFLKNTKSSS